MEGVKDASNSVPRLKASHKSSANTKEPNLKFGLRAFVRSFAFSVVSDRYDPKGLVPEEANAIRTARNRANLPCGPDLQTQRDSSGNTWTSGSGLLLSERSSDVEFIQMPPVPLPPYRPLKETIALRRGLLGDKPQRSGLARTGAVETAHHLRQPSTTSSPP